MRPVRPPEKAKQDQIQQSAGSAEHGAHVLGRAVAAIIVENVLKIRLHALQIAGGGLLDDREVLLTDAGNRIGGDAEDLANLGGGLPKVGALVRPFDHDGRLGAAEAKFADGF